MRVPQLARTLGPVPAGDTPGSAGSRVGRATLQLRRGTLAAALTLGVVLLIAVLPLVLLGVGLMNELTAFYSQVRSGQIQPGTWAHQIFDSLPAGLADLLERFGVVDVQALQRQLAGLFNQAGEAIAAGLLRYAALVWGPVAVYLLATDRLGAGLCLVAWGVLGIGLVDNLLRPILVGKDTRLSDWVVVMATLGGMAVFGLNGFVIGPAIVAMFFAVWHIILLDWRGQPQNGIDRRG